MTPVFTTGPTELHPVVAGEMARAVRDGFLSESHRGARFRREVERTVDALRALLGIPASHRVLFTSSATEGMERIVEGVVSRQSLHLVNGAFARRFHRVATNLGRDAAAVVVPDGTGFDADTGLDGSPELVVLTQNETSTGVRVPPPVVHELADRARAAGALVAVDLVSGWPVEEVLPERIDAGLFSVQKAFGLPAGLGVVVASPELVERSRERMGKGEGVGGYLHLPALADAADRFQTGSTPNMLAIRLLGRVAESYLEEGLDGIRVETGRKARRIAETVERLPGLRLFVDDPRIRSRTILVIATGEPSDGIRSRLAGAGHAVSDGYGDWKGRQIRIANFPMHTSEAVEGLLAALEVS